MNTNNAFFNEFNRLDKLCSDIYGEPHGVTCYINEMKEKNEIDCRSISSWHDDLSKLIKYRHIRNHLAHEENAFNESLCEQEDIDYLYNFYNRIVNEQDPLSELRRLQKNKSKTTNYNSSYKEVINSINTATDDTAKSYKTATSSNGSDKLSFMKKILLFIFGVVVAFGLFYLLSYLYPSLRFWELLFG
ncbi:MAG: hypothetical protein IJK26_06805 [Clostridia bacterium]|nr:hypothetical protein [Clostridia bacterium]